MDGLLEEYVNRISKELKIGSKLHAQYSFLFGEDGKKEVIKAGQELLHFAEEESIKSVSQTGTSFEGDISTLVNIPSNTQHQLNQRKQTGNRKLYGSKGQNKNRFLDNETRSLDYRRPQWLGKINTSRRC